MTQRPAVLPDHPRSPVAARSPVADALSDVLRNVRLTGALFFLQDLSSPCEHARVPHGTTLAPTLAARAENVISYHVITEGRLWGGLYDGGAAPVPLEAGDVLVVPRGDRYFIGMTADPPAPPDGPAAVAFLSRMASGKLPLLLSVGGGRAPRARIMCGFLGCDDRPFNPLLAALPRLLVVRGARGRRAAPQDRLERLLELTLAESQEPEPGGVSVRLRLSELIFVETIRRPLAALRPEQTGWLAGRRDEVVGRALALLHGEPSRTWTLPTLAKEVGTSRSALADRFARLVGQPPMAYLTQWRMQLAARLLTEGATKISAVATEVGYDSEAAFSRAFKRAAGTAPAAWRGRNQTRALSA
jgi:AraC-like DNA-binding protein